ncbi:MAG: hypothetical protein HYR94_20930 [Chloroflexi bacterium]|nr:hypothetical protein [Chloroflexota bacterium]
MTTNDLSGTVRLWDGQDGTLIKPLEGYNQEARISVTFNLDGTRILTISDDYGSTRLWDAQDGRRIATLEYVGIDAGFSPDGTRIVTSPPMTEDYRPLAALWIPVGLVLGLVGGLRGNIRETKRSPNQGIWLTIRNAIAIGLISEFIIITVMFVSTWALADFVTLPDVGLDSVLFPLIVVLALGLVELLGLFGLLAGLWFGGLDVIQHFILRLILACKRYIPWNYVRFLDYATERIFLRKVGGGYIFIHRLLLEYFASLTLEDVERLCSELEAKKVQPA